MSFSFSPNHLQVIVWSVIGLNKSSHFSTLFWKHLQHWSVVPSNISLSCSFSDWRLKNQEVSSHPRSPPSAVKASSRFQTLTAPPTKLQEPWTFAIVHILGADAVWPFWWTLTPGHARIIPPIVEETGWIIYRKPVIQLLTELPRYKWHSPACHVSNSSGGDWSILLIFKPHRCFFKHISIYVQLWLKGSFPWFFPISLVSYRQPPASWMRYFHFKSLSLIYINASWVSCLLRFSL